MIVKGNYTRSLPGVKASLRYYLLRSRGPDEPERELWGRDGAVDRRDAYALLDRYRDPGVAAHRLILSPSGDEGGADLRALTRRALRELEKDKGQALHWVAVEHRNTANPHVHVLLCGAGERDGEPRQVRLGRGDFGRLREEGHAHCREQERERDYLDRALDQALAEDGPGHDRDRDDDRRGAREAEPAREGRERRELDRDDGPDLFDW